MSWVVVAAILCVVLAGWASAIVMALNTFSPSAFMDRLEGTPAEARGAWLEENQTHTMLAFALLRAVLLTAVTVLMTVEVVGYGTEAVMSWPRLLAAGTISVVVIWPSAAVVAAAISEHVAEGLLYRSLGAVHVVALVLRPFTAALSFVDEVVRRLTGANLREQRDEAEAELLRNIEDSQREGGLDERSATMLENIVDFATTDVAEVMTPRTDIDGLRLTDDLAKIRAFIIKVGHSRIPVYEQDLDHIVGVLYVKDLIPYLGEDAADFKLRPILRRPIMVPETKHVGELLADFQRSEVHFGVVIDEYGGTAGLVTIEDVLEEIVGEIQDEHDSDDEGPASLSTIEPGRVTVDGRYHIDDLNEELDLELPEDADFDTVAGFVLAELGRVPAVGETFEAYDARFTTTDATPTHIVKVEVELLNGKRARVRAAEREKKRAG